MKERYDFIIAGAGSAGCVLANRLSADPHTRVLLIEAGPRDWNPVFRIPIMGGRLFLGSYCNWSYLTEPEPHLNGRRIPWPRGRVLGGSSAINGMIYTRGNRLDYDAWAQMGLREWSYDRVLAYFKRSEAHLAGANEYHGANGLLPVAKLMSPNPIFEAFVRAGQETGLAHNEDFNGAQQEGVGRYDYNIRNGERWSAARSFLDPARNRPNLTIITDALLRRVILAKQKAIGIELDVEGRGKKYFADREVILSCGAVGSPAALMHSGIGHADELSKLGIEPIIDCKAVGENLQDHLQVVVSHRALTADETYDECRFDRAALRMLQAIILKSGPFARMPHEGGAFLRSSDGVEAPDLQVHFIVGGMGRIRHPFAKNVPLPGRYNGYAMAGSICLLRPESRGRIALVSDDPTAKPKIEANYLSAETDRRVMRAGVKKMREIFAQDAFRPHRGPELAPGPAVKTDEEIDAYIAASASTVFHPVGTCRMGVDDQSVVDEELRVRGVEGLRVVDASIMPRLVSSNTHAPTVMIAERAADFILNGEELKRSSKAA